MLNSEQISRNAKYLECIPDPGTGPNSESIANPDPSMKSIEILKKVIHQVHNSFVYIGIATIVN